MDSKATRVAIVDDDLQFLQTAAEKLERHPGIQVVGRFTTPEKALKAVGTSAVDVLLVDQFLSEHPPVFGTDLIAQVRYQHPDTRCILLAEDFDMETAAAAARARAHGFLQKPVGENEVVQAIERILRGESPMPLSLLLYLLTRVGDLEASEPNPLTPQEIRVLRLVERDLSDKEIACELTKELSTIRSQLRSASAKLGATDRREAARLARRQGYLSATGPDFAAGPPYNNGCCSGERVTNSAGPS